MRQIDHVQRFHDTVIANRRVFLRNEISSLTELESARQQEIQDLSGERNQLMLILDAGGALEELNALYEQANDARARLSTASAALERVRELSTAEEEVRLRRALTRQEAAQELSGQRVRLDRVSSKLDSMMRRLYGRGAVLTVEVDNSGYKFSLKVTGVSSSGITRMQMLCFDLALLSEINEAVQRPDFLIHDSVVFDGVDPRQVSAALSLAHETVTVTGAQYLCTMNSSDIPTEIFKESWFQDGIIRVVYDTDGGGILGVNF